MDRWIEGREQSVGASVAETSHTREVMGVADSGGSVENETELQAKDI